MFVPRLGDQQSKAKLKRRGMEVLKLVDHQVEKQCDMELEICKLG